MRLILWFAWLAWAPYAGAAMTREQACVIVLEDLNPDPSRMSLAEKQVRFEAAVYLKEFGTGHALASGGREFRIPAEHLKGLTAAFDADFRQAPGKPGASPLALGNVGHVDDLNQFNRVYGQRLEFATGVDQQSLGLAIAAHDIGKAWLDPAIAEYIKFKGDSPEAAHKLGGLAPFVHNYVVSHEEHDIVRAGSVVMKYLEEQGINTSTPAGKQMLHDYTLQVIEAIRQHNGVDVTGDLRAKYPSLTDDDLRAVQNAWWATNYQGYADTLGLPKTKYGSETIPLGTNLNYLDRAALTADGAPEKLGSQNLSRFVLSVPWLYESFVASSRGNRPLLNAQADNVRRLVGEDPARKKEFEAIHSKVLDSNTRLATLGEVLIEMNNPAKLRALGVRADELPVDSAERPKPGSKVFLYVRNPQPGDGARTPSAGARLATSLEGYVRVDATDPKNPKTQKWRDGAWVEVPGQGDPAVRFAALARQAGLWGDQAP